jgi:primosomal replication protein N
MKAYKILVTTAIAVFLLGMCTQVFAQEGKQVVVKGWVQVTKTESGLITSVKIVGREGTYLVWLDENGNDLGAKKAGARVAAVGFLTTTNDENWLAVAQYSDLDAY